MDKLKRMPVVEKTRGFTERNSMRSKVNLFIAGYGRAGTGLLHYVLRQHREIYFPRQKELRFFSNPKQREPNEYQAFFKDARPAKYWGDASPEYVNTPETLKRIHAYNPDAKIILTLREPATRLFHVFLHAQA